MAGNRRRTPGTAISLTMFIRVDMANTNRNREGANGSLNLRAAEALSSTLQSNHQLIDAVDFASVSLTRWESRHD